jgi:rare lipoprotein A
LGTLLSVRNPANGVEVVVRVNDRGPFHPGRMVDLSVAAAQALGLMQAGVAMVVIRPLLSEEADSRSLGVQDAGTYPGQLPR